MKDTIIRLIELAGLSPEEEGACHGSAVLALQAFILGTEYQQSYIERLEKMAQLNLEPNDVLKHKLESRDEKGVLKYSDILAHLQTVKLFHSPDDYFDWFDSLTVLRQSDVAAIASIAQSQLAEKRGGIHQVSSFSAVYKHTEMDVYLTSLQKVMETSLYKETRCGLLLSSLRHSIMLGYDATNSVFPWTIDDDATVTRFSSDQYAEVAKKIRKIFTNDAANDKPLILCTAVYSIGDQLENAKSLIDSWQARCEKIHQVTAEKAKVIGQGGGTWLFHAAESGHTQTVELLLKKGADVNVATSDGRTPLFIAAGGSHTETVKLLLEKEVNIKAKTSKGLTALHIAAEGGHQAIVTLLLAAGADAHVTANNGWTPLHYAVDGSGYPAIAELLLEAGADVNAALNNGFTSLHFAAESGHIQTVELLLKKGADINAKTSNKQKTPLHFAAKSGCTQTVELLLKKGADINAKTSDKQKTPLCIAAENGHSETVELLLAAGADAHVTANDGLTPLHCAVDGSGYPAIAELLLEAGADVNAALNNGFTSLHFAAESGHIQTVELLLKKGADINAKTSNKQKPPLHFAAKSGCTQTVELLLKKGADINAKTSDKQKTPLCIAAENGHSETIELLRAAGAYANAVTDNGYTPRGIADDECLAIIKAFEKKGDINKVQVENNSAPVPVLLQRLFSFFVAASVVVLGIALSFYSLSSTPLLLAIVFTTAIVTAIIVKYMPKVFEQAYTFIVGSSQENNKTSVKLYEPTVCGLLTSPLDSQVSSEKTQQREAICVTNLEQNHYNRLSR